jgi:hypothetical protein
VTDVDAILASLPPDDGGEPEDYWGPCPACRTDGTCPIDPGHAARWDPEWLR